MQGIYAWVIFLAILVIICIIATLIFYQNTIECEQNESPLCPQFVCPGNQGGATRINDAGKKITSNNPLPSGG